MSYVCKELEGKIKMPAAKNEVFKKDKSAEFKNKKAAAGCWG